MLLARADEVIESSQQIVAPAQVSNWLDPDLTRCRLSATLLGAQRT
jgi:hypothetical protein